MDFRGSLISGALVSCIYWAGFMIGRGDQSRLDWSFFASKEFFLSAIVVSVSGLIFEVSVKGDSGEW